MTTQFLDIAKSVSKNSIAQCGFDFDKKEPGYGLCSAVNHEAISVDDLEAVKLELKRDNKRPGINGSASFWFPSQACRQLYLLLLHEFYNSKP